MHGYLGLLMVPMEEMTVVLAPDELVVTETTGGLRDVVVITFGFSPETPDGCASHFVFRFGSAETPQARVQPLTVQFS